MTKPKERSAADLKIQLKSSAAGAAILINNLRMLSFFRLAPSLAAERLQGEPWKGMPPPRDEKEKITRLEIRDAVIIYRILKREHSEAKALEVISEVVKKAAILLFDYLLDPINLEELSSLESEERQRFVQRNLERFPNAVTVLDAVTPEKVAFTVTCCHMAELCHKLKIPELAPVFCAADKSYFEENVGVNFRRDKTIASGDKICDFTLFKST